MQRGSVRDWPCRERCLAEDQAARDRAFGLAKAAHSDLAVAVEEVAVGGKFCRREMCSREGFAPRSMNLYQAVCCHYDTNVYALYK